MRSTRRRAPLSSGSCAPSIRHLPARDITAAPPAARRLHPPGRAGSQRSRDRRARCGQRRQSAAAAGLFRGTCQEGARRRRPARSPSPRRRAAKEPPQAAAAGRLDRRHHRRRQCRADRVSGPVARASSAGCQADGQAGAEAGAAAAPAAATAAPMQSDDDDERSTSAAASGAAVAGPAKPPMRPSPLPSIVARAEAAKSRTGIDRVRRRRSAGAARGPMLEPRRELRVAAVSKRRRRGGQAAARQQVASRWRCSMRRRSPPPCRRCAKSRSRLDAVDPQGAIDRAIATLDREARGDDELDGAGSNGR